MLKSKGGMLLQQAHPLLYESSPIRCLSRPRLPCDHYGARCLSLKRILLCHLIILQFEPQLAPFTNISIQVLRIDTWYSQSPHDIGSYLAGLVSEVQDGTTPSTQLKLRPANDQRIQ